MKESSESLNIVNSEEQLTIDVPPIVEIKDVVSYNGYSISGKFDFSEVPSQHHELFLVILLTRLGIRCRVYEAEEKEKLKTPQIFWEKLKNKFSK